MLTTVGHKSSSYLKNTFEDNKFTIHSSQWEGPLRPYHYHRNHAVMPDWFVCPSVVMMTAACLGGLEHTLFGLQLTHVNIGFSRCKKRNNDRVQETMCTSIAMQSYHGKELEIQMMVLSVK